MARGRAHAKNYQARSELKLGFQQEALRLPQCDHEHSLPGLRRASGAGENRGGAWYGLGQDNVEQGRRYRGRYLAR